MQFLHLQGTSVSFCYVPHAGNPLRTFWWHDCITDSITQSVDHQMVRILIIHRAVLIIQPVACFWYISLKYLYPGRIHTLQIFNILHLVSLLQFTLTNIICRNFPDCPFLFKKMKISVIGSTLSYFLWFFIDIRFEILVGQRDITGQTIPSP